MLNKLAVAGCALITLPVVFVASTLQDPERSGGGKIDPVVTSPATKALDEDLERLRAQLRELESRRVAETKRLGAELRDAEQRANEQAAELRELEAELTEALDMLTATTAGGRHRNCAPSRALISHYQWMRTREHDTHADTLLARILERTGTDNGRLNSLAWDLMNDKDTAGKFDRVALDLADRMVASNKRLSHEHLDTVALAKFLNGRVRDAVQLQQRALKQNSSSSYRRRLRTYEAALVALESQAQPAAGDRAVAPTIAKGDASTKAAADDDDDDDDE